jgi:hypothetical protein
LREFEWGGLFTPCSLELGESAYKGREARFMILTIELGPIPSLERCFQGKVKKVGTRPGLKAYAPNDFPVCGARLILQEKEILEQRKVRRNSLESLIEMDKDGDLKNGIGIEMDQFDLIMVKESAEEIVG